MTWVVAMYTKPKWTEKWAVSPVLVRVSMEKQGCELIKLCVGKWHCCVGTRIGEDTGLQHRIKPDWTILCSMKNDLKG